MNTASAPIAPAAATAWSERCRQLAAPIIEACTVTPVTAGTAALSREIARALPDWPLREILNRGGWYRLGGVIDGNGQRIAEHLEAWASAELEARGGDLAALLDDYAGTPLRATHLAGRTHYLVTRGRGNDATDYLQLEIEVLQETYAQPLFMDGAAPASLDELIDARCGGAGSPCTHCRAGAAHSRCGMPLGAASYRFRRLTHVGDLLARMRTQSLDAQPIHRFVADWQASSAGAATDFCHHWALALREHLDRYRQTLVRATPIPALVGELPRLSVREGTSGLSLHGALTAFDRAAGYPMAWFFMLLAGKAVPHWVPAAVASDAAAGFSYLPERDLALVKQWLIKPYVF